MESLFSFGLYVEHTSGLKSCSNPAVGFRLLDYPTVVVHGPSSSKDKCVIGDDADNNLDDSNCSGDDTVEKKICFNKGKSCLFKSDVDELNNLLKEIPLYVMVFDSTDQTSQLKGCCSIPLTNLFSRIENKVNISGLDSPAATEEVGVYALYNLMGLKTGEMKLQLKLNFYGTSLSRQIHHEKMGPVNAYVNLNNNNEPSVDCIKPMQLVEHVVPPLDTHQHEEKQTEHKGIQCNSNKYKPTKKQSSGRSRRKHASEHVNENFNVNIFCPPPLFLNLCEVNIQREQSISPLLSSRTDSQELSRLRSRYGSPDSLVSIQEPYTEVLQPVENRTKIQVTSKKGKGKDNGKVEQLDVNDDFRCEKIPPRKDTSFNRNLQSLGNFQSNLNLPQDVNGQLNVASKLPLLSALSAEIMKLATFFGEQESNERNTDMLNEKENKKEEEIIVELKKLSEKASEHDNMEKAIKPKRADIPVKSKKEKRVDNDKRKNKNIQTQKGKLKFKTTRTQKLRSMHNMKQCKQTKQNEEKIENLNQKEMFDYTEDKNFDSIVPSNVNVPSAIGGDDDVKLDSLQAANVKVGDWISGLESHMEVLEQTRSDQQLEKSVGTFQDIPARQSKSAPSTPTAVCQGTTTGPGFFAPPSNTGILPFEHEVLAQNRTSSLSKRELRSSRSRGIESRNAVSRNNESTSMYAYDTFSSEDPEEKSKHDTGHESSSVFSQTSSISLPVSGKDSDRSGVHASKASDKSKASNESRRPHTGRSAHSLPQHSTKSDKSLHRRETTGDKSANSISEHSNVSSKSGRSSHRHHVKSVRSDQSSKRDSRSRDKDSHSQDNLENIDKSKMSSEHLSNKVDTMLQQQNDASADSQQQLHMSNSQEKLNSSLLSSVKLERYMGGNTSSTSFKGSSGKHTMDMLDASTSFKGSSGKHTMDMLDDSRPATQASVNTLPEDSVFSPRHVSSADQENEIKDIENSSGYSPTKDMMSPHEEGVLSPLDLVNSPTGSLSPDKMNVVRPNNSTYSPRKSKHNTTSFQVSKRTHGMGKLEERPLSELSGDTTMREIDMFIGDDSQLTSGSSVVMTTDESVSPIASANIPRKYKHGINKFDTRQVETVEEVDVSANEEEDELLPIPMSTYTVPMQSDFSPHQSKQFVQKKRYDVFRETLPPFSSNTNESSNDGVP